MSASQPSAGGGVDLPTLAITAAASATAAYVCSKLWAPGTLGAAATMPVLVALLKEAYAKPAVAVTRAVPVRGVVRSTSADADPYDADQPADPGQPGGTEFGRVAQQGELVGRSRPSGPRAWKTAVVTGLLGFVIAAVIITVPEFVAGKSAAGGDRSTTFFGGDERRSSEADDDETETTAPTQTQSVPPAGTVTVPPVETTTVPPPTTTVPPAQTTPAPPAQPPPAVEPPPEPPAP